MCVIEEGGVRKRGGRSGSESMMHANLIGCTGGSSMARSVGGGRGHHVICV